MLGNSKFESAIISSTGLPSNPFHCRSSDSALGPICMKPNTSGSAPISSRGSGGSHLLCPSSSIATPHRAPALARWRRRSDQRHGASRRDTKHGPTEGCRAPRPLPPIGPSPPPPPPSPAGLPPCCPWLTPLPMAPHLPSLSIPIPASPKLRSPLHPT
jgi:hypothetical protein